MHHTKGITPAPHTSTALRLPLPQAQLWSAKKRAQASSAKHTYAERQARRLAADLQASAPWQRAICAWGI